MTTILYHLQSSVR